MTTATSIRTPMDSTTRTEALLPGSAALLRLIWLASPALPVGGFSYSEGLEAAVDAGLVTNEPQAGTWLVQQLHLTLARADLPVLAQALRACRAGDTARVHALNAWVLQTRESAELRLQTEQMGRSLREWLRQLPGVEAGTLELASALEPSYPVLFALAAAGSGAGEREVLLAYAFGWAENMVQATLKAVPLGQSAGQRILARLVCEIPAAVDGALVRDDQDRQAFSPMLAILSSRHETQYSRLFRS